jgi:hypothetical protein
MRQDGMILIAGVIYLQKLRSCEGERMGLLPVRHGPQCWCHLPAGALKQRGLDSFLRGREAWSTMLASSTCSSSEVARLDSILRGRAVTRGMVFIQGYCLLLAEFCRGRDWTPGRARSAWPSSWRHLLARALKLRLDVFLGDRASMAFNAGVIYLQ